MNVPYVDLSYQHSLLARELLSAIERVLHHGHFILGDEVTSFEEIFADKFGYRYAVGMNSGTDALILSMQCLDIGSGDEVITVPNSFLATTSSIILTGATPVFVDVGQDQNIAPSLIEEKITGKTKAIIPVHLTGRPAKMDAILAVAERHGLIVLEDCAQAVGAMYKEKYVGHFGIAGCYSLHPLKNLSACGDAGIVVTNDETLFEKLKIARNHGLKNRDECVHWSLNSRLDTMQAAILSVKIKYIDQWTQKRRDIADYYCKALSNLPIQLPIEAPDEKCVYHTFVIQTEQRDSLRKYLIENGIDSKIHYPFPIHLQKAAAHLGYSFGDFPVTEEQVQQILSIPIYPELTDQQLQYIVRCIQNFFV